MSIRVAGGLVLLLSMTGLRVEAQGAAGAKGPETRMVVSVADHLSHKPKTLTLEDIRSIGPSMRVTKVEPLQGDRELFILIDDGAGFDFGEKVQDLRRFVNNQPASAAIGVAYFTDGDLKIAQTPTRDHELVEKAIRAPKGGKLASSFCALSSLILGWSPGVAAREVIMITSGIDYSGTPGGVCTNAEIAIADAQRAGVRVYAIYHPVADYAKQDWRQIDEGLIELSHVCYESGGEACFVSHGPLEIIGPFLRDISDHLANQYVLTISVESIRQSGFQRVLLDTGVDGPELMAPARVWAESPAALGGRVTSGR